MLVLAGASFLFLSVGVLLPGLGALQGRNGGPADWGHFSRHAALAGLMAAAGVACLMRAWRTKPAPDR